MKLEELDYQYPKELIALEPVSPRDTARLLVYKEGQITHSTFRHLSEFLQRGDILVLNKTKVFPARVFGVLGSKKIEIVFLSEISPKVWEVMIGGKVGDGDAVVLPGNISVVISKDNNRITAKVPFSEKGLYSYLEKNGHIPLPPYIKRPDTTRDKKEYQTVFAKKIGSAAAPTAGLHFTDRLVGELKKHGVQIEFVTLHVGLGTFAPVKSERVEDHPIHTEYFEIDQATMARLAKAKKAGRRVIACGTTSVRALESSSSKILSPTQPHQNKENTNLFIYPGYKFRVVDGIITNFHTPRSSLLALVYAFSGQENIRRIYQEAIREKYRFFSYGDGMLLL